MLALANLFAWSRAGRDSSSPSALAALRLLRLDAPAVRYLFLRVLLVICLVLPFVQPRVPTQVAPRRRRRAAASAPCHDARPRRRRRGDRLQACRVVPARRRR